MLGRARVAQSVKCPTLDFSPGQDLRVTRLRPVSDSMLHVEFSENSLSLNPSPSYACLLSLSKKTKKI